MNELAPPLRLDFETPSFLHALFANDFKNLTYLDRCLELKTVTRDGWISFQGSDENMARARRIFEDLEASQRAGRLITSRDFRLAVQMACQVQGTPLNALCSVKLVGARGRKPVSPRTPSQLAYVQAIEAHDVTFGIGPAGTGKTYLAMAVALHQLKKRQIHRVVLTRPAVEAGEALGFLPGDLREKVAPYLRPLYDAINDMIEPDEAQRWFDDGTIEIAPLAFMRGRTLARSFVILDEAQNTTREQMFMALTRLGEESRMVITGDSTQTDLKPGIPSGLNEAQAALAGQPSIAFIHFQSEDIIRHPVVETIVKAYQAHRARA